MKRILLLIVAVACMGTTHAQKDCNRYAEDVAKSFIYRFPDPDDIRWGNQTNHFT